MFNVALSSSQQLQKGSLMSELSLAYIFHHQQLLVDQNLQLPKVEKLASDLLFTHDEQVIARDLLAEEPIPEGLQLVPIRQLITSWSKEQFLQASRAVQLLEWRRNHKFCSHCGHPTEVHPTEYAMVCPSCRYHQYPRVNPCIITVITRGDDEILLAKSVHNKTNMYGLIAGFVEVGETLEEAVQREAFEEVGLKLKIFNICQVSLGHSQVTLWLHFGQNMSLVKLSFKKKKLQMHNSSKLINYLRFHLKEVLLIQ